MKKVSRLIVCAIALLFLFAAGLAVFSNSYAWEKKRQPTKSGVKAKARGAAEKGVTKWESLSPEQQEYFKKEARVRGKRAKITGEEYWNSLSAEEQQQAVGRFREGAKKGRKKWQDLPE